MEKNDLIYVAGHRGMVGGALLRRLRDANYLNVVTRTRQQLDLTNQVAVADFMRQERPNIVILAAAKVGGIYANHTYPADFIYENTMIASNIIHASYRNRVRKLLFLGSSCIYPKFSQQPIVEGELLSGALEPTNEAYALAKITGIKMCGAYNKQYGTDYMSVMPTNLYGPGDHYDPMNSHVIPALIHKIHQAKIQQQASVMLWGSGAPYREFLYCEDLADACLFLMENYQAQEVGGLINIGCGEDITILDLARHIAEVIGYHGSFEFDRTKPDGTPRKRLDVSRLNQLGWQARTSLQDGLKMTYQDFLSRFGSA